MTYRPGTHNGPSRCVHGRTTAQDNCRDCWNDRGWKDLRWDGALKKFVVAVLPDGTVTP
jgi:hypothetical protein